MQTFEHRRIASARLPFRQVRPGGGWGGVTQILDVRVRIRRSTPPRASSLSLLSLYNTGWFRRTRRVKNGLVLALHKMLCGSNFGPFSQKVVIIPVCTAQPLAPKLPVFGCWVQVSISTVSPSPQKSHDPLRTTLAPIKRHTHIHTLTHRHTQTHTHTHTHNRHSAVGMNACVQNGRCPRGFGAARTRSHEIRPLVAQDNTGTGHRHSVQLQRKYNQSTSRYHGNCEQVTTIIQIPQQQPTTNMSVEKTSQVLMGLWRWADSQDL